MKLDYAGKKITMEAIEITFFTDHAIITITDSEETVINRVKPTQVLVWMNRQGIKWTWTELPDGTEQAVWERD